MEKVFGMIVTYNPEIERLNLNIDKIFKQLDKLVIYDNHSKNIEEIKNICNNKKIEIICYDKNYGIATPLYDSVIYADQLGYDYILTLDQDSIASENMIFELLSVISKDEQIAMVGAKSVDERRKIEEKISNDNIIVPTHRLITSGSLARVKSIIEVGNYKKELFIDYVDFEICYRLYIKGYKLFKCNSALLNHRPGNPHVHKLFGISITTENYSPFRLYYFMRNVSYCKRLYKHYLPKGEFDFLILYGLKIRIKILLFEENKLEKIIALCKGKKDSKNLI